MTEWYRAGADAEQAEKHESMLGGWLNGTGGEQIIVRAEGGIVRVTRMWMEVDGTVNSETMIKELEDEVAAVEVQSLWEPDDDDDDIEQALKIELVSSGTVALIRQPMMKEVSPVAILAKLEKPKPMERSFLFERKSIAQRKISEFISPLTKSTL